MPICAVKWCRSSSLVHNKDCGITFHAIPSKNLHRQMLWINAIRLERHDANWVPGRHHRVCSMHFSAEDFTISNKGYSILKNTAVPICTMVVNDDEVKPNISQDFKPDLIMLDRNLHDAPSTSPKQMGPENISSMHVFLPQESKTVVNDDDEKPNISQDFKPDLIMLDRNLHDAPSTSPKQIGPDNISPMHIFLPQEAKVSCPNCDYHFSVTLQAGQNSNINTIVLPIRNVEPREQLNFSPIDIPSSDPDIVSALSSPEINQLREKLKFKTLVCERRLATIKKVKRSNGRLVKKCEKLKQKIINNLGKNKLVKTKLNLGTLLSDIVRNIENKKKRSTKTMIKITPAIRKFALTLNYHSRTGYKYVRQQFDSCLPHPSTMTKWYQTIGCKPGFTTEEAIRAIETKLNHSNKNLAFLMVDEMAIRQQNVFNGKEMDDLVSNEDSDEIADPLT